MSKLTTTAGLLLAVALVPASAAPGAQSRKMDNVQSAVSTIAAPLPRDSVYQLPLALTDQHGRRTDWRSRRGKPQVVAMFYSSCRYICPLIIEGGKAVDRSLTPAQRSGLGVLLISMDPARDTPAALAALAKERKVDPRWSLASPAPDGRDRVLEPGFLLVTGEVGEPTGFAHVRYVDDLAHLAQLSVLPERMRAGLGSALVRAAMREAWFAGFVRLYSDQAAARGLL